jgi:hypothetical protein
MNTSIQFDHIPLSSSWNDKLFETKIKEKIGTRIL